MVTRNTSKQPIGEVKAVNMATGQLVEALSEGAEAAREEVVKTSRRARKQLERNAEKARKAAQKDMKAAKSAAMDKIEEIKPTRKQRKAAAKDAKIAARAAKRAMMDLKVSKKEAKQARNAARSAAVQATSGSKKRRKWPLVVGLGLIAAGAAYAMRPKAEPPLSLVPPQQDPARPAGPSATTAATTAPATPAATPDASEQPKHAMETPSEGSSVQPTPPAPRNAMQDKQQKTGAEKRA